MSESPALKLGPPGPKPAPAAATSAKSPSSKTAPTHPATHSETKGFGAVLRAVGEEARRGELLMKRAASGAYGKDLAPGELLALQAGVYRYVEVVDLASKLVDRVAQGAKQLVSGGGQ